MGVDQLIVIVDMAHRFPLRVMLGKLVTHQRMCGYDTLYAQEEAIEADDVISERAAATGRTVVTRDRALTRQTDNAIFLTSREIENQLAERHDYGIPIELPTHPKRCSV